MEGNVLVAAIDNLYKNFDSRIVDDFVDMIHHETFTSVQITQ